MIRDQVVLAEDAKGAEVLRRVLRLAVDCRIEAGLKTRLYTAENTVETLVRPGRCLQETLICGLVEGKLCRRCRGFCLHRVAKHHHASAIEVLVFGPFRQTVAVRI